MVITHASHHSWFKETAADSLSHYGKSDKKRLSRAIIDAPLHNIKAVFAKADETFFEWFIPLYNETITQKNNPLVFDVRGTTVDKPGKNSVYKTLTLLQGEKIVGGCIFSCWEERYSIAYRIFSKDWPDYSLTANPALYAEYLMDEYTRTHEKATLSHGLDRNPYGINSSIGLAMFKLSVGCKAKLRHNHLEKFALDTDSLTTDTLVLHYPETGELITEATLVCNEQNLKKYEQLFSYGDRLKINTIIK